MLVETSPWSSGGFRRGNRAPRPQSHPARRAPAAPTARPRPAFSTQYEHNFHRSFPAHILEEDGYDIRGRFPAEARVRVQEMGCSLCSVCGNRQNWLIEFGRPRTVVRTGPAADRHLFVRLRRQNTRLERAGLRPAAQPRAPLGGQASVAVTRFQEYWSRAFGQFELRVELSVLVQLSSGTFQAPVLLRDFGSTNGMILVAKYESISSIAKELVDCGYGYSCLGEPHTSESDAAVIIEILRDWGWSGRGEPPEWLVDAT